MNIPTTTNPGGKQRHFTQPEFPPESLEKSTAHIDGQVREYGKGTESASSDFRFARTFPRHMGFWRGLQEMTDADNSFRPAGNVITSDQPTRHNCDEIQVAETTNYAHAMCSPASRLFQPIVDKLTVRLQGNGMDKYPAKSHAHRVAEKMGTENGLIVLEGAKSELYPDSDIPVPFRQDRYFFYMTGCDEANCVMTFDITTDKLILWLPLIDESKIVWTGRGSTVEEAMDRYDIDEARYIQRICSCTDLEQDTCLNSLCKYLVDTGRSCEIAGILQHTDDSCKSREFFIVHEEGRSSPSGNLKPAMNACRLIKDGHEVDLIRKANEISAHAHAAVLENLHAFTHEAQVEAMYTSVCIAEKAKHQAYAPIAGSGANASELHYTRNDTDFGSGQTLVLDAGAEVSCYASDVTRTLPLNPQNPGHWASKEAENIYHLVEAMQEECIKCIKPGIRFIDLDRTARDIAIRGLLELGILKGNPDDIRQAGTLNAFFYHGLGHSVGLEVHDVMPMVQQPSDGADTKPTPEDDPPFFALDAALLSDSAPALEDGMVFTVEPGLYFNAFLLQNYFLNNPKHSRYIDKEVLQRYVPAGGVRIEDDILVTRYGYENLTTAPKGEKALEIIRNGARKARWDVQKHL